MTEKRTDDKLKLLQRYRNGKASQQEIEQVDQWFDAFDSFDGTPVRSINKNKLLDSVHHDVLKEASAPRRYWQNSDWLKIAALLILLTTFSFIAYRSIFEPSLSINYVTVKTEAGEQKKVNMPDGSVVWLNHQSSIKYKKEFNITHREVRLQGEAFFEVMPDTTKPFIVKTQAMDMHVLGTSFNVQSYSNDAQASLAVATGKVKVVKKNPWTGKKVINKVLLPNDILTTSSKRTGYHLSQGELDGILSWKEDVLYFDNESISSIVRKLERKFDIEIKVEGDDNPGCRYTVHFNQEPLDVVLKVLAKISGMQYHFIKQDKLLINTETCK